MALLRTIFTAVLLLVGLMTCCSYIQWRKGYCEIEYILSRCQGTWSQSDFLDIKI